MKDCFYRISTKALIKDEMGRVLLIREGDMWELPGGGLEHGEIPQDALVREIYEEMGLEVIAVSEAPAYITTSLHRKGEYWIANIIYEVQVKDLNFVSSSECEEIHFFTKEEALLEKLFPNVKAFLDVYKA